MIIHQCVSVWMCVWAYVNELCMCMSEHGGTCESVYVWVCMNEYMNMYSVCVWVCECVWMCECIWVCCMSVCMNVCECVSVYCVSVCVWGMHVCVKEYVCMLICICMCVCVIWRGHSCQTMCVKVKGQLCVPSTWAFRASDNDLTFRAISPALPLFSLPLFTYLLCVHRHTVLICMMSEDKFGWVSSLHLPCESWSLKSGCPAW